MLFVIALKIFCVILLVWENKLPQSSLPSYFCSLFFYFFTYDRKLQLMWNTWLWKGQRINFFSHWLKEKKNQDNWESKLAPCFRGLLFPVVQEVFYELYFFSKRPQRGQQKSVANIKFHFKTLSFLCYRFIISMENLVPSGSIMHHSEHCCSKLPKVQNKWSIKGAV